MNADEIRAYTSGVLRARDAYTDKSAANHGTTRGYAQHRRSGEEPCDDCRAARSAYSAALYQEKTA